VESSKQPRKQRKTRYNAPLHQRRHYLGVHLSKELKAKLTTKRRSVPVVKGDKVKVLRGKRKGLTGKVARVDLTACVVYLEGLAKGKARGTEVPISVQPSNLLLLDGDFAKKGRKEVIDRNRAGAVKPAVETTTKTTGG